MSRVPPSRPKDRYGDPGFRRLALAPALVAALALLIGVLLIGQELYTLIRFLVSILAIIMGVFAVQARQWMWLPLIAAIAVLWNPVVPIELPEAWLLGAHYLGIAALVVVGVRVKVPSEDEASGRAR